MNHLEDELKEALRRVEPPAGFEARILARVAARQSEGLQPRRTWLGFLGWNSLRWAAACTLCVALAASGVLYQREQQRRRGEEAKEQLMLALRITSSKLQMAQQSVREINSGEPSR